jgi:hypothetical protein
MPISIQEGIVNESWNITYDNETVELKVERPRHPHSLFVSNTKGFKRKPWETFFRFLNELVWFYDITVTDISGGMGEFCANMNFLPNEDSYAIQLEDFAQSVDDEIPHLALGFFREGISSKSPFYQFLCYSKILEIPFKDGVKKGKWIDQEIPELKCQQTISSIVSTGNLSIGDWIRSAGRNAVSHGRIKSGEIVRDPNVFQDWDEINQGNILMEELAIKAMIECIGIPRSIRTENI